MRSSLRCDIFSTAFGRASPAILEYEFRPRDHSADIPSRPAGDLDDRTGVSRSNLVNTDMIEALCDDDARRRALGSSRLTVQQRYTLDHARPRLTARQAASA